MNNVYPLAKIAADFNSATFKSIKQHFGEHKFVNFSLKFVDLGLKFTKIHYPTFANFHNKF